MLGMLGAVAQSMESLHKPGGTIGRLLLIGVCVNTEHLHWLLSRQDFLLRDFVKSHLFDYLPYPAEHTFCPQSFQTASQHL